MIHINYKIERNESDRTTTFLPNQELLAIPNLSFVEGPNSSGKSTILNLIALAFNGIKNDTISDSLKEKMKSLLDESYQTIEYSIKIETDEGTLEIQKSQGNNNRAHFMRNGIKENVSMDNLMRQYNLIYDIPEDPTARLSQLTQTITQNQKILKERVKVLKELTRNQLISLEQSRDEDAIASLEKKITMNIDLNREQLIKNNREIHETNLLKKYTYLRETTKKQSDLDKARRDLEAHQKLEKNINSSGVKTANTTAYKRAKKVIGSIEILSDDVISRIESHYPNQFEELKEWKTYSFNNAIISYSISISIIEIIKDVKAKLTEKKHKIEIGRIEIEKEHMLEAIINVLKHYSSKGLSIPGVNQSIEEYIVLLENERKPYTQGAKEAEIINELLENINEILKDIFNSDQEFLKDLQKEQLKALTDPKEIDAEEYYNTLNNLKTNVEKSNREFEEYKAECIKMSIDIENKQQKESIYNEIYEMSEAVNWRITSFTNLNLLIQKNEQQTNSINNAIKRREEIIIRDKNTLEDMKKREEHKYAGREKDLQSIISGCDSLLVKINNYSEFINRITKREFSNDPEFLSYNELISNYLGQMLGEVAHIDKRYKLKKVDILKQELCTQGDKIIRFSDMGTGQSQSAYLLGKLINASSDNRKIIVLFDEIAMMDGSSLKPIKEKMIALYKQGKLAAGIMVQRNDHGIVVKEIAG